MRSILQVGNDTTLRTIRASVLRLTGASVLAASADEAMEILRRERFDLVVFCHTVNLEQREKIARAARELYEDVRVLNVLPLSGVLPAPDEAAADPERLLAKVNEALQNAPGEQQPSH
jgi:DNA-binding NtrC family response regulator